MIKLNTEEVERGKTESLVIFLIASGVAVTLNSIGSSHLLSGTAGVIAIFLGLIHIVFVTLSTLNTIEENNSIKTNLPSDIEENLKASSTEGAKYILEQAETLNFFSDSTLEKITYLLMLEKEVDYEASNADLVVKEINDKLIQIGMELHLEIIEKREEAEEMKNLHNEVLIEELKGELR